ncbi:sensor histidine kinase [Arthrobacter sp. CDRTa11]|uniref:sensor histidine kinase n=1 Tax=Arthrobacter sp. CDRTa11 TaxID=2651199 RepID=UPI002265B495|nr:histidine kinase [Arthrobacter sp. CDRTa11]
MAIGGLSMPPTPLHPEKFLWSGAAGALLAVGVVSAVFQWNAVIDPPFFAFSPPAHVSLICAAAVVFASAMVIRRLGNRRLTWLTFSVGAALCLYPFWMFLSNVLVWEGGNTALSGTMLVVMALSWHVPCLLLLQLLPIVVAEDIAGRSRWLVRYLLVASVIFASLSIAVGGLARTMPQLEPLLPPGWALGSFLQWFSEGPSSFLWLGSFLVSPVTVWLLVRATEGERRQRLLLAGIASLVPVFIIVLCSAGGMAVSLGGLGGSIGFTVLIVGFAVSCALTAFLVAGAVAAETGRGIPRRLITLVLSGTLILTVALAAASAGIATAGSVWQSSMVTIAVAVVLIPFSLKLATWCSRVLDPRENLLAELRRRGKVPSGTEGQAIEAALRAAMNDAGITARLKLPDEAGWVDSGGLAVSAPGEEKNALLLGSSTDPHACIMFTSARSQSIGAAIPQLDRILEPAVLEAAVRYRQAAAERESARAVGARAQERARIVQDMHDGVQGRLLGLALNLQSASRNVDDAHARLAMDEIVSGMGGVLEELRLLALGNLPAKLASGGLHAALSDFVAPLPIPVYLAVPSHRVSPQLEAMSYFVVAEAVTNSVKHAHASYVDVKLLVADRVLSITVADDGVGSADLRAGTGLRGLAERVRSMGGHLLVSDRSPSGTLVEVSVPCESS